MHAIPLLVDSKRDFSLTKENSGVALPYFAANVTENLHQGYCILKDIAEACDFPVSFFESSRIPHLLREKRSSNFSPLCTNRVRWRKPSSLRMLTNYGTRYSMRGMDTWTSQRRASGCKVYVNNEAPGRLHGKRRKPSLSWKDESTASRVAELGHEVRGAVHTAAVGWEVFAHREKLPATMRVHWLQSQRAMTFWVFHDKNVLWAYKFALVSRIVDACCPF